MHWFLLEAEQVTQLATLQVKQLPVESALEENGNWQVAHLPSELQVSHGYPHTEHYPLERVNPLKHLAHTLSEEHFSHPLTVVQFTQAFPS